MQWPSSQDYNEAVQIPADSFADPELSGGQALTNSLGLPMARSGNFADVYEFVGAAGAHLAVKCFTRRVPGLHERYSEVSKHLVRAELPFSVNFTYLQQGVNIRGSWYPILKMDWVDGFLLNEFVRDNLDKPERLDALAQIWVRTGKWLHGAAIVHGDLQHGNVILVRSPRRGHLALKLIDYDGMSVPALADKNSGEVGHPSYQHPQRVREGTYGPEVDRFSQLVVYTALRALSVRGKPLWDQFDNGDNLLFRQQDFEAPGKSPLFAQLLGITEARQFAAALIDAARVPLAYTPFLAQVVPEALQPSTRITIKTPVPAPKNASGERPKWMEDVSHAVTARGPDTQPTRERGEPCLDIRTEIPSTVPAKQRRVKGTAVLVCLCCLVLGVIAAIAFQGGSAVMILAATSWLCCVVVGFFGGRAISSRAKLGHSIKAVVRNGEIEVNELVNLPDETELSIPLPRNTTVVPTRGVRSKGNKMAGMTAMLCLCCFLLGLGGTDFWSGLRERILPPSAASLRHGAREPGFPSFPQEVPSAISAKRKGNEEILRIAADGVSNSLGKTRQTSGVVSKYTSMFLNQVDHAAAWVKNSLEDEEKRLNAVLGAAHTFLDKGDVYAAKRGLDLIVGFQSRRPQVHKARERWTKTICERLHKTRQGLRDGKRKLAAARQEWVELSTLKLRASEPSSLPNAIKALKDEIDIHDLVDGHEALLQKDEFKTARQKLRKAKQFEQRHPRVEEASRSLPQRLIKVLIDSKKKAALRVEAGNWVVSLGPVKEATMYLGQLLGVLKDPGCDVKVRHCVVRVVGSNRDLLLEKTDELIDVFNKVIFHETQQDSLWLRNACACEWTRMNPKVPGIVLSTISEFLQNKKALMLLEIEDQRDSCFSADDALKRIVSQPGVDKEALRRELRSIAREGASESIQELATTLLRRLPAPKK